MDEFLGNDERKNDEKNENNVEIKLKFQQFGS